MAFLTVQANEIRVGDQIYLGDYFAKNPNHRWADIKKVKQTPTEIYIITNTTVHKFDPGESVPIQRFD